MINIVYICLYFYINYCFMDDYNVAFSIRHHKKLMRAQKSSMKTESLPTQKSSLKLLPQLTCELDSANSSCGLINHERKLSLCYLRNHQQNWIHGWRIDSTPQKAHASSEIINENWVSADSENITETASTADTWTRQRKQLLWAHKSSTKTEHK